MFWRVTSIAGASLWVTAAFCQTVPPVIAIEPPVARAQAERALREFMKSDRPDKTSVCSIPLVEVTVKKGVNRMPVQRPPAKVEPMPFVGMPAPPCQEEKR